MWSAASGLPLPVDVECYAGYRGEETSRRFGLAEAKIEVAGVIDCWLAPDHRYFKVRDGDGDLYILRNDVASERWELTFFRAARPARSRLRRGRIEIVGRRRIASNRSRNDFLQAAPGSRPSAPSTAARAVKDLVEAAPASGDSHAHCGRLVTSVPLRSAIAGETKAWRCGANLVSRLRSRHNRGRTGLQCAQPWKTESRRCHMVEQRFALDWDCPSFPAASTHVSLFHGGKDPLHVVASGHGADDANALSDLLEGRLI